MKSACKRWTYKFKHYKKRVWILELFCSRRLFSFQLLAALINISRWNMDQVTAWTVEGVASIDCPANYDHLTLQFPLLLQSTFRSQLFRFRGFAWRNFHLSAKLATSCLQVIAVTIPHVWLVQHCWQVINNDATGWWVCSLGERAHEFWSDSSHSCYRMKDDSSLNLTDHYLSCSHCGEVTAHVTYSSGYQILMRMDHNRRT